MVEVSFSSTKSNEVVSGRFSFEDLLQANGDEFLLEDLIDCSCTQLHEYGYDPCSCSESWGDGYRVSLSSDYPRVVAKVLDGDGNLFAVKDYSIESLIDLSGECDLIDDFLESSGYSDEYILFFERDFTISLEGVKRKKVSETSGDLMTLGDFLDKEYVGEITKHDGHGYFSDGEYYYSRVPLELSFMYIPSNCTHVLWFNK